MRRSLSAVAVLALALPALAAEPVITWKKTVVDAKFRSEGVAVADVNKDGKIDVLNGEYWYEAPDWKAHEMQPPREYHMGFGSDGKGNNYSHSFACWADDFNGDGFPDLIVIDFPGDPCFWMENPKGKDGHWKKHVIWHSACNETPLYKDLLGDGKKVLIMGFQPPGKGNEGQMAYFTPDPKDANAKWIMHPISKPSVPVEMKDGKPVAGTAKEVPGTQKFSHGLGVGDVNADGKLDVLCTGGWWEQPSKVDGETAWMFHPAGLGEACADMYVADLDGDGKMDVLTTSAHKFGIWAHIQKGGKDGHPAFQKQELFKDLVSESHAAHFVDIDGDGLKDLVTGKRWGSHGRAEPGATTSPHIYYLKAAKSKDGLVTFAPIVIDDASGIGTQFALEDINGDGLLDVITSNKRGVHVIVQQRK